MQIVCNCIVGFFLLLAFLPAQVLTTNDQEADVEVRVTMHDDGTRTVYKREKRSSRLEAITYESAESDVVVIRKVYELDELGRELHCWAYDGAVANPAVVYHAVYVYDEYGRRKEEGTYDSLGQLMRVVAYPVVDGTAMRPVVTRWRHDGVLWTHGYNETTGKAIGVVPLVGQEEQTGIADEDLVNLVYDEESSNVHQPTELEMRAGVRNTREDQQQERSFDEIIQGLDEDYLSEDLSAEELMRLEEWRRLDSRNSSP